MKHFYTFLLLLSIFTFKAQVLSVVSQTNINCTNDMNGSVTFSINGSAFPYDVSLVGCNTIIVNGITTNTFTVNGLGNCLPYLNLSPNGEYTVTLSDNTANIVAVTTYSVNQNNPFFLLQEYMRKGISCPNANDGISQWQAVYGSGPFNYVWSTSVNPNYATGPVLSNAAPGMYTITATDVYGCKLSWWVSFTNPYLDIQTVNATQPTCCNGSLNYNVVGIIPPPAFSYTVSPSITSNTAVCSGTYTISASSNTCFCTGTVNLGCTTSIDELEGSSITLFPNPAVSEIYLEIPEGLEGNEVSVTDYLGRTVMHSPFKKNIDVSALPHGVYFLNIRFSPDMSFRSKFVKE